eukprot:TRINITY_DN12434_c1_g2_i3.p1 TRINITY_DN12434_c1_g2~~TRINITY_DN12434_c1_g2_i3.p1  ORF type:complete len:461 (+),score=52.22 TRINITY_DN12434_c1_g2_i3:74-1456(+)
MRHEACWRIGFEQVFIAFCVGITLFALTVFVTNQQGSKDMIEVPAKDDSRLLANVNKDLQQELELSKVQAAAKIDSLHARLESLESALKARKEAHRQENEDQGDEIPAPRVLRGNHDQSAMRKEPHHDVLHLKPQVLYRNDTCDVNPSIYFEDTGVFPIECLTKANGIRASRWTAVVLSLPAAEAKFQLQRLRLKRWGMDATRFEAVDGEAKFGMEYRTVVNNHGASVLSYASPQGHVLRQGDPDYLTAGERGYLASMEKLFATAVGRDRKEPLFVMDDDFVLSCDFDTKLQALLAKPRCGGLISSAIAKGGVLLLGSTVYIDGDFPRRGKYAGGWKLIAADKARTQAQFGRDPACFNINQKVFGSYAVLYHPDTFKPILQWIKTSNRPFDHVYGWLSRQGHPVRAASDPIVIQDLAHVSSVNRGGKVRTNIKQRAKQHRWQLSNFCVGEMSYMNYLRES